MNRLAALPPIVVCGMYLLLSLTAQLLSGDDQPRGLEALPLLIALALHVGWAYSVYDNAARLQSRALGRWVPLAFVAPLAAGAVIVFSQSLASFNSSVRSLLTSGALLVGVACMLIALWAAAKRLVLAEEYSSDRIDKVIGTFLLMFYLPIGVWFLRPRVEKVLS